MTQDMALDRFVLAQTHKARPRVAYLGQAGGESQEYLLKFYQAMEQLDAHPSHLSLFKPHTADLAGYLQAQDVIYVGGGNTKSMLALWREWGVDEILRMACASGIVLAGVSAGANCWFEQCITDSIPGPLTVLNCLGFLPGSFCPHYDGEAERRPRYRALVAAGEAAPGIACDDDAAAHFVDGQLAAIISARAGAQGYRLTRAAHGHKDDGTGAANEIALETHYLSAA